MKTNDERLKEILKRLDELNYIKLDSIPNIDLYMDQVTTFMDGQLSDTRRYPDDKVLTKTMINNYAQNDLLPAPFRKKYTREHILLLVFIYYFKNLLSISDIEELFRPIREKHFNHPEGYPLSDIYKEIFSMEAEEKKRLTEDIKAKFSRASNTFHDEKLDEEEAEYLQLFAFICQLSFDVYLKKQIIEQIIDELRQDAPPKKKK